MKEIISRPILRNAIAIGFAISLFILLRLVFWGVEFPDFTLFLDGWIEQLRSHGPGIVGSDFANYHPPYLYLLWLLSTVIPDNLSVVKFASVLIDGLLAVSVFLIAGLVRNTVRSRVLAGVGVLFLPTVVINGAAWGQCDALYTSMLLFVLYAVIKHRLVAAWVLFAAAIAVKTQAIFLAPFMVLLWVRSGAKIKTIMAFAATLIVLLGAPVFSGYSLAWLLQYYVMDAEPMFGVTLLSWWLPNSMSWLPDSQFQLWRGVGIGVFLAILALSGVAGWRCRALRITREQWMMMAFLSVLIVPFVLPQMHERYYFAAEIIAFSLAVAHRRWLGIVVALQIITLIAMSGLFAGVSPKHWAYQLLSVGVFAIIGVTIRRLSVSFSGTQRAEMV